MNWKVLHSEYLFNEPWLTIRKEVCSLPNGKMVPAYYILEYPTWVNALALTKEGKVVMVRQYRHGLGVVDLEVVGGVVDKGEDPETAIRRELLEETGYRFASFELLGRSCANPATTNNYTYFYLATGGEKVAAQNLDETEDIEVVLLDMDELKNLLRSNGIVQALHTTCIFYGLEKLGLLQY